MAASAFNLSAIPVPNLFRIKHRLHDPQAHKYSSQHTFVALSVYFFIELARLLRSSVLLALASDTRLARSWEYSFYEQLAFVVGCKQLW